MSSISQIVIMNYYKREAEGRYLKKLIDVSASRYGIPVQIAFDDGSLGIWKNYAQALTMPSPVEGTHRLILHDDMSFSRNILEKILYILDHAPADKVLMLYNPTNTDYVTCREQGRHVLETDINFWAQAGLYPNDFASAFVDEMNVMAREERADDDRLSAYLRRHGQKLYSVVPSLLQHYGAARSTFNFPESVGGVNRFSSTFDSQFKVQDVNWEAEFANPFKAKLTKDYVKLVYKEEYLNA